MRAGLIAAIVLAWVSVPGTSTTLAASMSCTLGLTLTLHPGLPPSVGRVPLQPAPDIPHGPFTVSAPLYPGAKRLSHFVASPLWDDGRVWNVIARVVKRGG